MKQVFTVVVGMSLFLLSCNKNDQVLSPEDQAALDGLISSFNKAAIENDSCISNIGRNDSAGLHYHDSLFHYHEDMFGHHHGVYSHGNHHDDHEHHNGGRDHHNGGMQHNCCDGHHEDQHIDMEQLVQSHQDHVH